MPLLSKENLVSEISMLSLDQQQGIQGKWLPQNGGVFAGRAIKLCLSLFASVRLTILLLTLIAATTLVGAWCPQQAQVGQDKVIEQFGEKTALLLINLGIADIFHSFWFLLLIALLTINLIVGSFKSVFPKLLLLRHPMPLLCQKEIANLPIYSQKMVTQNIDVCKQTLSDKLRQSHYQVCWQGNQLRAEFGKVGRLAPTITHIGLLTLLAGVTITAWTGFSGFQAVAVGSELSFTDAQHASLWLGHLPSWHIHVNSSHRENYKTGEAKQWYSNLSVVDQLGRNIKNQEISVNNPLSYQGVDIYQSSWGLSQLDLTFNQHLRSLALNPMGKLYAAFLPLTADSILIFSLVNQDSPVRIFAKRPDWPAPQLIGMLAPGKTISLGSVVIGYKRVVATTGLQYKCDPGLIITYTAFALIMLGVTLAAIPHQQIWAELSEEQEPDNQRISLIHIGGSSAKAKIGLAKQIDRMISLLPLLHSSNIALMPGAPSPKAKETAYV